MQNDPRDPNGQAAQPQPGAHGHMHAHAYGHAHPHAHGQPWAGQGYGYGPGPFLGADHHGGFGAQGHAPHPQQAAPNGAPWIDFRDERFVKGLLVGAAATFLLTNEGVQKGTIRSLVRLWGMLQGGVEEMKERFRDAEAELQSEQSGK